jgi:hypothetical protein
MVTIACLFGAIHFVNPWYLKAYISPIGQISEWIWASFGVTAMVLTQALGILLEELLLSKRWLGAESEIVDFKDGTDPRGESSVRISPYSEYKGLYILLAEIGSDEDTQGHLQRSLAQFFLSVNTLVSYASGIAFSLIVYSLCPTLQALGHFAIYAGLLALCIVATHRVAASRFRIMGRSLWATRRRRLAQPRDT